jgi:hypothetical protein
VHQVRRGATPVLTHRGADRELPARRVLNLRLPRGRALIDQELYLPKTWTDNRGRCAEAGIGQDVEFATKPALTTLTGPIPGRSVSPGATSLMIAGSSARLNLSARPPGATLGRVGGFRCGVRPAAGWRPRLAEPTPPGWCR